MLAVIIINVLLALLVLGAIVGSHLWAVLSASEAEPQARPAAPARARSRRRRPQAAPMPRRPAAGSVSSRHESSPQRRAHAVTPDVRDVKGALRP
jgi:hypothetical protein